MCEDKVCMNKVRVSLPTSAGSGAAFPPLAGVVTGSTDAGVWRRACFLRPGDASRPPCMRPT